MRLNVLDAERFDGKAAMRQQPFDFLRRVFAVMAAIRAVAGVSVINIPANRQFQKILAGQHVRRGQQQPAVWAQNAADFAQAVKRIDRQMLKDFAA